MEMTNKELRHEIYNMLQVFLDHRSEEYYHLDAPTITDNEYDYYYRLSKKMEDFWPDLITDQSRSQLVGWTSPSTYRQK